MSKNKTITTFKGLVDSWTDRMMELDHKVTANRRSIDGLEKQIEDTYQEMEDIQKAAYDLLGDKLSFNLYENEDNAIRISYKSNSMSEPLVNIVKDRKIQVGKEPNKSEKYFFAKDSEESSEYLRDKMLKEPFIGDTMLTNKQLASIISMSEDEIGHSIIRGSGQYSSIKQDVKGIEVSVGNINSKEKPTIQRYRVRLPESAIEVSPDEIAIKGDTITLGGDVMLIRYEEPIRDLAERVTNLEELLTPKQDPVPAESDESPILQGVIDTETTFTMKDYDDFLKATNKKVGKLSEPSLKHLQETLVNNSYAYNIQDFYGLASQLYIMQEAFKKKEDK